MPTKKPVSPPRSAKPAERAAASSASTTSARSTVSGPSNKSRGSSGDDLVAKQDGTQSLAAAMPFNPNKPNEYGPASAKPRAGATVPSPDPRATGSTLTEQLPSDKLGTGK